VTAGITAGLRDIGRAPVVWRAAAYSIGIPVLQAFACWLVMRAYGLEQSFAVGAVVFLIVHVGTAVPNTPANVGSYQLLTVLGLGARARCVAIQRNFYEQCSGDVSASHQPS
jgi:uncharacterized membrane protein YbhN (UPF0104 family)